MTVIASSAAFMGTSLTGGVVPVVLAAVASAAWLLEFLRRNGGAAQGLPAQQVVSGLRRYSAEGVGLACCVALAAAMVIRGEHQGAPVHKDELEMWEEIQRQWPLLMTADTLLGFQAMLRLLLLLSSVLRHGGAAPLVGTPAAFWLLAATCRLARLYLSPLDVYHLDGPLGGWFNVLFEVAAYPLLLLLSRSALQKGAGGMLLIAGGFLVACGVAHNNLFALADEGQIYLDTLFSLEHLLECLGAAAVLAATAASWQGGEAASSGFVHVLLPLMQFLPFYFLMVAFGPPFEYAQEIVRQGYPFQVLQMACALQVLFSGFAAGLHVIASADDSEGKEQGLLLV